jgi:hypothetical protein
MNIAEAITNETNCERARAWADYLKSVVKVVTTAAVTIVLAAAGMVLLAFWLVSEDRDGQALASGAGAIATGALSSFVFAKQHAFKQDYETAEQKAQTLCV